MKIIDKSLKIAYGLFKPNPYQRRYHFAIAFDGKKPIGIGQNNPNKMNAKAKMVGDLFNIQTYIEYPFLHAEVNLLCNLWNEYENIDPSWKIVVLRINRPGKLMMSKPCNNCEKILSKVNLKKIIWSGENGVFCQNSKDSFSSLVLTNPNIEV